MLNGDALNLATQRAINETFCTGEIDTVTHRGSSVERGAGKRGVGSRERPVFLAGLIGGPATSARSLAPACPASGGPTYIEPVLYCNMQYAMELSKDALSKLFFPHIGGMAS